MTDDLEKQREPTNGELKALIEHHMAESGRREETRIRGEEAIRTEIRDVRMTLSKEITDTKVRVDKLETWKKKHDENHGEMEGVMLAALGALASKVNTVHDLLNKVLKVARSPWFYAAVLAGAAVGGFVAAMLKEVVR